MPLNHLLERQLHRHGASPTAPPSDWEGFLKSVAEAYQVADQDRLRVERSMDLMSLELTERYEQLRKEVADRERMEIELRLAQKLESVGQLAAGIAHEINTPVQYVSDSLHFLKGACEDYRRLLERCRIGLRNAHSMPDVEALRVTLAEEEEAADLAFLDEQVPKAFDRVFDGTSRVASIVRAVKEFAHHDSGAMAPADVNRAMVSTLTVSRSEYKGVAVLETDFGTLPPVRCLIGDLNQVFLNLIVNATHAIADRARPVGDSLGTIRVATRVDGEEVVISVSDSGCGIPETIRDRVFDPFFTTKEVGRGTGQGLALSRSIVVERHGGSLTFETEVGRGTTFFVRLPIDGPSPREMVA
jgi:signal transduction histidine kinase